MTENGSQCGVFLCNGWTRYSHMFAWFHQLSHAGHSIAGESIFNLPPTCP